MKPCQTENYLHQNVSIWELFWPTLDVDGINEDANYMYCTPCNSNHLNSIIYAENKQLDGLNGVHAIEHAFSMTS